MLIKEYYLDSVKCTELTNKNNFKVQLVDLGAAIYGVYLDGTPLTLTTVDINDFKRPRHYHGKTIGRLSGRIYLGQYEIHGKKYQIDINDDVNALHGGENGISNQCFDVKVVENENYTDVVYTYLSKDGESGFNGDMYFVVTYRVYEEESKLELTLEATPTEDTICMLTNHVYFSLGDYDNSKLMLKVNSTYHVVVDEKLIPSSLKEVNKNTDFRTPRLLVESIEHPELRDSSMHGYDMEYIFDTIDFTIPQVELYNDNYHLAIYCDTAGTIIYSDNFENTAKFLTNGDQLRRRGIAIEPSDHHLKDHYIDANEKYVRHITYVFKKA